MQDWVQFSCNIVRKDLFRILDSKMSDVEDPQDIKLHNWGMWAKYTVFSIFNLINSESVLRQKSEYILSIIIPDISHLWQDYVLNY